MKRFKEFWEKPMADGTMLDMLLLYAANVVVSIAIASSIQMAVQSRMDRKDAHNR